ncbi:hypothetical protein ACJ51O_37170 (plasmid) [Burkholderia pyrrocinia]|uniref:hypothetical protein n=1 Tax=Burkholderia pyrrocinia TaxID=60550 RepID=UPI0038B6328E
MRIAQKIQISLAKVMRIERRSQSDKAAGLRGELVEVVNAVKDGGRLSNICAQYRKERLVIKASGAIGIIDGKNVNDLKSAVKNVCSLLKEIRSSEKSHKQNLGRMSSGSIKDGSLLSDARQEAASRIKWISAKLDKLK